MNGTISAFIGWASPIVSTIIVAALTAQINMRVKREEAERAERNAVTDAKRKAEAEWQNRVETRLTEYAMKMDVVLALQCAQMRSDITHKCHRYLDDLGMASTEEKQSLWAENEDYRKVCEAYGIENHYIDALVERVMNLPERTI